MDEAEAKSSEELAAEVKFCKAAKCYRQKDQEDQVKLILCLTGDCKCKQELEQVLTLQGFKKNMGKAPPSFLERDLVEWLEEALQ